MYTILTTFPNIDIPTSREATKPLLEAVAPLQRTTSAGRSVIDFYSATSSALSRVVTEDFVYVLYAPSLDTKMVRVLRWTHLRRLTEVETAVAVAHPGTDMDRILGADTLVLLLTVDIEAPLLAAHLVVAVALEAILAGIPHRDVTCTPMTTMTEERSHLVDQVVLATRTTDMEVIACLATRRAPGMGAEESAAFGCPMKVCHVTVAIMGTALPEETW